jgi:hypothetical protein
MIYRLAYIEYRREEDAEGKARNGNKTNVELEPEMITAFKSRAHLAK